MGVGSVAAEGLKDTLKYFGTKLGNLGVKAAPAVEETVVAAAKQPNINQVIFKEAIPSAAMTAGFNLLGGAGLPASLAAGAIDLGANVGLTRLAGKLAPGSLGTITYKDATGRLVTKQQFMPSAPQAVAQAVSPIISSLAIMPLTAGQQQVQQQQLSNIDQTSSIYQQSLQRDYLNNLRVESLSPGTNFQMQGLESTYNPYTAIPLQVPQSLDPYGLSRGSI